MDTKHPYNQASPENDLCSVCGELRGHQLHPQPRKKTTNPDNKPPGHALPAPIHGMYGVKVRELMRQVKELDSMVARGAILPHAALTQINTLLPKMENQLTVAYHKGKEPSQPAATMQRAFNDTVRLGMELVRFIREMQGEDPGGGPPAIEADIVQEENDG